MTSVAGMNDALNACFAQGKLPSEIGVPWAVAGQTVSIDPLPVIAAV